MKAGEEDVAASLFERQLQWNSAQRAADIAILLLMVSLLSYRLVCLASSHGGGREVTTWQVEMGCDPWFTFVWVLIVSTKWNLLHYLTFPQRLLQHVLCMVSHWAWTNVNSRTLLWGNNLRVLARGHRHEREISYLRMSTGGGALLTEFGNLKQLIKSVAHAFKGESGMGKDISSSLKAAHQVVSCSYDYGTAWGEKVGLIYGSTSEDVVTRLTTHSKGWGSAFCSPDPPGLLGLCADWRPGIIGPNEEVHRAT
ncbi:hypothetical protein CDL15_Pgr021554 [Punica granatum]|uniref:Uncharacterized protein n=1 Tax=Punica granatum TaxID=22663 RepID=A0A218WSP0_PUNGR|nr:hypothetical protein CDL15_Pgr021554 [Punica granatum]